MRALNPVEAAVAVALAASVLATALPSFVRNLHASRLVEPIDGLNRIASQATVLAAHRPVDTAFPETAPLTPEEVPKGERVTDPATAWDHPTWQALSFAQTEPHSFSFAFESRAGAAKSEFRALAYGDLDGDGLLSTFRVQGQVEAGRPPSIAPMEMRREVE